MICTTSNTPIEFNDEVDARMHSELLVYGYCRKQCDSFMTDDVMDIVMNYLHFPKGLVPKSRCCVFEKATKTFGAGTLAGVLSELHSRNTQHQDFGTSPLELSFIQEGIFLGKTMSF